jgi:ABC-type glycerol-3-phosphate transport system substrate-binding protein
MFATTTKMVRVLARASALVAVGLVAAACSSDGGASATAAAPSADAGGSVAVTLQEWAVVPAQDSVGAGAVTFDATNEGPEDPHEFVVFKTDLGPRDLPTTED